MVFFKPSVLIFEPLKRNQVRNKPINIQIEPFAMRIARKSKGMHKGSRIEIERIENNVREAGRQARMLTKAPGGMVRSQPGTLVYC